MIFLKRKQFTCNLIWKFFFFMNSINILISIDQIEFHIMTIDTSFLLYLINMNKLQIYLNKFNNVLIIKNKILTVIHQFEHSFLLWNSILHAFIMNFFYNNSCFLTDFKFHLLHRRFSHFSVMKLHILLNWSEYNIHKSFMTVWQKSDFGVRLI